MDSFSDLYSLYRSKFGSQPAGIILAPLGSTIVLDLIDLLVQGRVPETSIVGVISSVEAQYLASYINSILPSLSHKSLAIKASIGLKDINQKLNPTDKLHGDNDNHDHLGLESGSINLLTYAEIYQLMLSNNFQFSSKSSSRNPIGSILLTDVSILTVHLHLLLEVWISRVGSEEFATYSIDNRSDSSQVDKHQNLRPGPLLMVSNNPQTLNLYQPIFNGVIPISTYSTQKIPSNSIVYNLSPSELGQSLNSNNQERLFLDSRSIFRYVTQFLLNYIENQVSQSKLGSNSRIRIGVYLWSPDSVVELYNYLQNSFRRRSETILGHQVKLPPIRVHQVSSLNSGIDQLLTLIERNPDNNRNRTPLIEPPLHNTNVNMEVDIYLLTPETDFVIGKYLQFELLVDTSVRETPSTSMLGGLRYKLKYQPRSRLDIHSSRIGVQITKRILTNQTNLSSELVDTEEFDLDKIPLFPYLLQLNHHKFRDVDVLKSLPWERLSRLHQLLLHFGLASDQTLNNVVYLMPNCSDFTLIKLPLSLSMVAILSRIQQRYPNQSLEPAIIICCLIDCFGPSYFKLPVLNQRPQHTTCLDSSIDSVNQSRLDRGRLIREKFQSLIGYSDLDTLTNLWNFLLQSSVLANGITNLKDSISRGKGDFEKWCREEGLQSSKIEELLLITKECLTKYRTCHQDPNLRSKVKHSNQKLDSIDKVYLYDIFRPIAAEVLSHDIMVSREGGYQFLDALQTKSTGQINQNSQIALASPKESSARMTVDQLLEPIYYLDKFGVPNQMSTDRNRPPQILAFLVDELEISGRQDQDRYQTNFQVISKFNNQILHLIRLSLDLPDLSK